MDEIPGRDRHAAYRFVFARAAQSVKLALDPNSEPNIAGYVLRYGTIRGSPVKSLTSAKPLLPRSQT